MLTDAMQCRRHGESTRITCVDCGDPICPRCLVRTEVGLKCEDCAQPAVAPPSVQARGRRTPLLLLGLGTAVLAAAAILLFRSAPGTTPEDEAPGASPTGRWEEAADLATIRGGTTAAVLRDGTVLVAGGGVGSIVLPAAETFDAGAGRWRPAPPLAQPRRGHQAVVLGDGRVLVVGGIASGTVLASAEVYHPASGWLPAGAMSVPRLGHSLTLLADGRVLAAGGTSLDAPGGSEQGPRPVASAEIYDPASGTWTAAGSMAVPRFEHTATLLGDGRVLMAGGLGPGPRGLAPSASTEVYDPAATAFVRTTDLTEARTNHAAVALSDRSVLVVGGAGGANGDVALPSAEVFDPRQGNWRRVEALREGRTGHTATRLADGRVLVAGGESVAGGARRAMATAEVFEPAATRWRPAGAGRCPGSEQVAVLLADGSVLVVGGDAAFPGKPPIAQSCAARYHP